MSTCLVLGKLLQPNSNCTDTGLWLHQQSSWSEMGRIQADSDKSAEQNPFAEHDTLSPPKKDRTRIALNGPHILCKIRKIGHVIRLQCIVHGTSFAWEAQWSVKDAESISTRHFLKISL